MFFDPKILEIASLAQTVVSNDSYANPFGVWKVHFHDMGGAQLTNGVSIFDPVSYRYLIKNFVHKNLISSGLENDLEIIDRDFAYDKAKN